MILVRQNLLLTTLGALWASTALANPFPFENQIKADKPILLRQSYSGVALTDGDLKAEGQSVLRIQVRWDSTSDTFALDSVEKEQSGTDALAASARYDDPHGSYKARLVDPASGKAVYFAVIGTGSEFRKLTRMLTFRFPMPTAPMKFELIAENSQSGIMESILSQTIDPATAVASMEVSGLKTKVLRAATKTPKLIVNVYAEGYAAGRENQFWTDAAKVPAVFSQNQFPMLEHFEIRGVFASSNQALGHVQNLGLPVPTRDSFLGLYYPYWSGFGRYQHIIYPTNEIKFRRAIGSVPYDYPIVLVDTEQYWGMGNFKEFTAVPARNDRFGYLLMHEFGHYFGLNEEYEGGGTELSFAPDTEEPWSQNITFNSDRNKLKWHKHVHSSTRLPTPGSDWNGNNYGAYAGGYGEDFISGQVFKPGQACIMSTGDEFCPICSGAIEERIKVDLGLASPAADSTCECKVDPADATQCALYKNGEKLAWTQLFGGKSCDQAFCGQYFKVSQKAACGR